jgi:hypothetical protein
MMKYLTLSLLLFGVCSIKAGAAPTGSAVAKRAETTVVSGGGFTSNARVFEDSIQSLYTAIGLEKYDLPYDAFRYAMIGYYSLNAAGKLNDSGLVSIIDFTKPSTAKRFFTVDVNNQKVVFNTLVAHGRNTGENLASAFSNKEHSNQSSLGFYITGETYVGSKGYSLRLDGMDKGYNDQIRSRAVVMHNADYVSEAWIQKYGRLGRSQGCPALPKEISRKVIDTIKDKSLVFAYYNDAKFLASSEHLDLNKLLTSFAPVAVN